MRFAIILALGLCANLASAAQLLIEPYVGYHMGNMKQTGVFNDDVSGVSYGGRLGVQQLGFMFGFDYMTGQWTEKSTPQGKVTPENIGVFVGYDFPLLVRAFAEYDFSAKQTNKYDDDAKNKADGDSAVKLGVGLKIFPMISLNFEYIAGTYSKMNGNSIDPNLQSKMYGVSLSLPFLY